jgi:voltage-gated potassium channel
MATEQRRWKVLHELEDWIEKPMLVLSAAWLAVLVVELAWETNRALQAVGAAIWVAFILEFLLRLFLAPKKVAFVGRNLLTVAALLVPAFRLFRVVRVVRLARFARGATLLRVVAGANRSMNALRRSMRRRGFGYVLALTLVVCVLGAVGMRTFEADGPNAAAFATFADALWWTAMILTTMGSQAWPETPEGRVLALLLSIYAFAVFGYVAAALASYFVGADKSDEQATKSDVRALALEIKALREELERARR